MISDDAAWVVLRHRTDWGMGGGRAWHTYRWQAACIDRPPSGWRAMTASCPWCRWRHHFELASARTVQRRTTAWLAGMLVSAAVAVASIVVLVVADLDWSGIEPAYWFGGVAAGAVAFGGCIGGVISEVGVRQRRDPAWDHQIVGARTRRGLPSGYALPSKPLPEGWDELHAVDGQSEAYGRYRES